MREPKLIDYTLLTLLSLIWASAFFNIKVATYSYGPVMIAFMRIFWSNSSSWIMFNKKNKNRSFFKGLVLVCINWSY